MTEIKRVHESIEDLELYLGRELNKDYSSDTLYVCYSKFGVSICHEHTKNTSDTVEKAVEFDIGRGYTYYYAKVNHHLHKTPWDIFKESVLGCEFVRVPYEKSYRQFVHGVELIDGETHLVDQKGVCSLFRTARFYKTDDNELCASEEFMDFLKEC